MSTELVALRSAADAVLWAVDDGEMEAAVAWLRRVREQDWPVGLTVDIDALMDNLEEEVAGYQEATNKNQAELGRIVGLQDALAMVRKAAGR